MKPLRVIDIIATAYPCLIEDKERFVDAWRQLHYITQAVVEVGKGWGEPKEDDSHTALQVLLPGHYASVGRDIRCIYALYGSLIFEHGGQVLSLDPDGATLDEVTTWVRETAHRLAGPPRQASAPAPDLPEHPTADGAAFDLDDSVSAVRELYRATASLLRRLVSHVRPHLAESAHELTPRIWPHHFDLASLFVVDRDTDGNMAKTVGVGLAVPDGLSDTGYWYISPWSKRAHEGRFETPPLPFGRWVERGSTTMAVLPVSELCDLIARSGDGGDGDHAEENDVLGQIQACALAEFVAAAFNACADNFGLLDDA